MARATIKGRSVGGPAFVQLHHYLTDSQAWRWSSPGERAVYLEIARLYNGKNNGALALSARAAAERCRINKDTANKAFSNLRKRGLIECVTTGSFSQKINFASEWRLTAFACDKTGRAASKEFMRWRPPPSPQTGQQNADHGPNVGAQRSPRSGQ